MYILLQCWVDLAEIGFYRKLVVASIGRRQSPFTSFFSRWGEAGIFSEANPKFRGLVNPCLTQKLESSQQVMVSPQVMQDM